MRTARMSSPPFFLQKFFTFGLLLTVAILAQGTSGAPAPNLVPQHPGSGQVLQHISKPVLGPRDLQEALSLSVPILTVAILAQGTISKPWHHAGLFFLSLGFCHADPK